jgi:hypothetical protein
MAGRRQFWRPFVSTLTPSIYQQWQSYFEEIAKTREAEALVYDERPLSDAEKDLIGRSLAQFQLGEHSEGHHLIGKISAFAHEWDKPALARIGELLAEEEKRHAGLLGTFMDHHEISRLESHWVDTSFRFIRRFGGLDLMLTTLLIAVTIATQYYRCLGPATRSPMLKRICVILREEEAAQIHLLNQMVSDIRSNRSPFGVWFRDRTAQVIFSGALLIVWFNHGKIYRRAGIGFKAFWPVNWQQWRQRGAPPQMSVSPHLAPLLGLNQSDTVIGSENSDT